MNYTKKLIEMLLNELFISNKKKVLERSATLCVARAVRQSHGKITITLDSSYKVTEVDNK